MVIAEAIRPLALRRNSRLSRISTLLPPPLGEILSSQVLPGASTLESITVWRIDPGSHS
jgi:hypothetical protein